MLFCNLQYIQKKERKMLPADPKLLLRLIRSNTSFLIYGQKASGKTRLIRGLLDKAEARFIEINCTLTSKRANFLWLFNVELKKHLKKEKVEVPSLGEPTNLDSWISELKKIVNQKPQLVEALDNLYVFMDNIEEMTFQQSFIPSFYTTCQKQFNFRFSFIFCGINFLRKEYTLDLPFRTMIAFCMPKPDKDFKDMIEGAVEVIFKEKFGKKSPEIQIEKAYKGLVKQIKVSFEDIESNLQRIKSITKVITEAVVELLDPKQLYKTLSGLINKGELKKIIDQVKQHGPLQENILKHKIHAIQGQESHEIYQSLEYYPQLILASFHMADYYNQKEDKRRFQDYKGRSNHRNKDLKRSDFKIGKHNLNRIIAISEALESQAKENDKEYAIEHHTLDYYATFQNLRNQNRLKHHMGGKVSGIVKQEEVKAFISKCELKYEQFMSS